MKTTDQSRLASAKADQTWLAKQLDSAIGQVWDDLSRGQQEELIPLREPKNADRLMILDELNSFLKELNRADQVERNQAMIARYIVQLTEHFASQTLTIPLIWLRLQLLSEMYLLTATVDPTVPGSEALDDLLCLGENLIHTDELAAETTIDGLVASMATDAKKLIKEKV